jgi:Zn-dependent M32 family carboxypeptidase
MQNYLQLEKEIEEINQINNVVDILSWDIAVNMPIGSAESRTNGVRECVARYGLYLHERRWLTY